MLCHLYACLGLSPSGSLPLWVPPPLGHLLYVSVVNESPVVVKPYKVKMSELEGLRYRVRVRVCQ